MKKHIVFALGDYYPSPSANGICVEKIIDSFTEAGYNVDVVANSIDGNKTAVKDKDVSVHFVELPLIDDVSERMKKEENAAVRNLLLLARKMLALRLPLLFLTYPVSSIPRCIKYKRAVDRIIKNEQVAAVIGVHKPIEAVYGAYAAAQRSGIPFFGYFLDPLVGGYHNKQIGERITEKNSGKYEKRIIDGSKKTIFMNSHYDDVTNRFHGPLKGKLVFLGPPLLKENTLNDTKRENTGEKTVLYAGSLYEDIRNPRYIMEAFRHVKTARLEMYVPNPVDWIYRYTNDRVTVHEGVPHKEIITKLESADALLNIGNSTSIFIPSKIIEYISMKKPIISTFRIDDDPCLPYLEKYPDSLSLDERLDSMEETAGKIDRFITQARKDIPYDELKKTFYINTPEAFVEVIESGIKD